VSVVATPATWGWRRLSPVAGRDRARRASRPALKRGRAVRR